MIDNIKIASNFAHNDRSSVLSNVLVLNGQVTAQNDMVGISLNIESDVDFCCNANMLTRALNNCDPSNIKLSIKNKKLHIQSGRFKSNIEIIDTNTYPVIDKDGDVQKVQGDILNKMNLITQFTDPNDVRMALRGVELSDESVNATNGHVAVKVDIDEIKGFNNIVIPSKSIMAMAKINAHVDTLQSNGSMVFFNFNDGYLFSRLIDQKMPDINRILSELDNKIELSGIKDAVKSINSMCDVDKTIILGPEIKTRSGDSSISGFNIKECAFNSDYLLKIIDIADHIDFSPYPSPCPFEADNIKGAVVGVII